MTKQNIITSILLVLAIVIGVLNLRVYSSLRTQGGDPLAGVENTTGAATTRNIDGKFVSVVGGSLTASVASKDVAFVLGPTTRFYIRVRMSDAKYQEALKAYKNAVPSEKGTATAGSVERLVAPIQDSFKQVSALSELNLKSGDSLMLGYNGEVVSGKTGLLSLVKVVEVK